MEIINTNQKELRIGQKTINKQGLLVEIIEYKDANNIVVKFENGYKKKTWYKCFKDGSVSLPIDRVGQTNYSNEGYLMTIVEYKNENNMIIEFQDKYKARKNIRYKEFLNGKVKNPFHKSLCGVGYVGILYNDKIDKKSYHVWSAMIRRCYENKNIAYKDWIVCDEWLCYANFKNWFDENYYEIDNEKIELDKDILVKGNKVYSPNTCVFVPSYVNCVILLNKKQRGKLPVGICYIEKYKKYSVSVSINKKRQFIGNYNDISTAFQAYKQAKENEIKRVADLYKNIIPKNVYDALYKWEIEITD